MPCLIGIFAFFLPRVAIAALALLSTYITGPFSGLLIPILGFIFAPYTLLAYCLAINNNGKVDGLYLVLVIIAVLMDLGVIGGGARGRRRMASSRS